MQESSNWSQRHLRPLFIGGTGRSGTSIVKRVIAGHESVASFPTELRVIIDPGGALDLAMAITARWSPYAGDAAVRRFETLLADVATTNRIKKVIVRLAHWLGFAPPSYLDFGIGDHVGLGFYRQRCEQLLQCLSPMQSRGSWAGSPGWGFTRRFHETPYPPAKNVAEELQRFFHDLFTKSAGTRPVTHWVEDTPYNLLHVDDLLAMFPGLRFIHVHRDFRDVAASYRVQPWGSVDPRIAATRVAMVVDRWLELRPLLSEDVLWEVGLESIVQDRRRFYERFLEFTGLPGSRNMERMLEQLDPRRMHGGRWKKELDAGQHGPVQQILARALTSYGYE
jgi:hypothetical protein